MHLSVQQMMSLSVSVLGIDIVRPQSIGYYWVLGAQLGIVLTLFVSVDCVLQVGYRRHSRMTERHQVLPLQFRCEASLMLCNRHLKFTSFWLSFNS